MPHRERYLFVCINRRSDDNPKGSCAQKGSEEVAKKLKAALKSRGVADRIRSCTSSCLDLCESGISIVQEPEHFNDVRTLECLVALDPGQAHLRIGQRVRVTITVPAR